MTAYLIALTAIMAPFTVAGVMACFATAILYLDGMAEQRHRARELAALNLLMEGEADQ